MIGAVKEIIVENPFYLRARVHDSQTATVLFEIARQNNHRACRMYKFTIRRNQEYPYSMPEQNLTYWRNSLELKHLPVGDYRICAIICSEHLKQNHSKSSISACVNIHAYRSHFLVLTLYILVVIILTFSQITFTLRKRRIQARIQAALIEVEGTLQKWRTAQASSSSSSSINYTHSYNILQSLVTIPASPTEHLATSPLHPTTDEHRPSYPIIFHLGNSVSEIP